jgi:5'-3' exonuclease
MEGVIEAAGSSLMRAIRQHGPTHVVVVLEQHDRTWRHLLYPGYKANRGETPALLLESVPRIQARFEALGVASFSLDSYEADDVIATLTQVVSSNRGEVIILSTDKTFLQLIDGQRVKLYNHFNDAWMLQDYIIDRYEIKPVQYLDYLALVGDRTNNIHGVKGIGQKSAVQLLAEYEDLQSILDAESNDSLVRKVQASRNDAERSRMLVALKKDVALGINLRTFRLSPKDLQD